MGGNFTFQFQDSFLDFFLRFGDFEKRTALSEKKPPLNAPPPSQI